MLAVETSHCRMLLVAFVLSIFLMACGSSRDQIGFISDRNGNDEIYVMGFDGTNQIALTIDATTKSQPRWSKDGGKIAYLVSNVGKTSVRVMDADGSNVITPFLSGTVVHEYRWSPGGERLAMLADKDGKKDIYVADFIDGVVEIIRVTDDEEIESLGSWSSDSDWLSYSIFDGKNPGVYIRNPDGVDLVRLTNTQDLSPIWSPEGNLIAFVSQGEKGMEIHTVNHKDLEREVLTAEVDITSPFRWSPDGKKIVYVSNRDGNLEIYTMKSNGSEHRRLTRNGVNDTEPSWIDDGEKITFVSMDRGDSEIFLMDADGSRQLRLTNNANNDFSPN